MTTRVTDVASGVVLVDNQEALRTFRLNENRFRITLKPHRSFVHLEMKLDGSLVYSGNVQKEGLLTG